MFIIFKLSLFFRMVVFCNIFLVFYTSPKYTKSAHCVYEGRRKCPAGRSFPSSPRALEAAFTKFTKRLKNLRNSGCS